LHWPRRRVVGRQSPQLLVYNLALDGLHSGYRRMWIDTQLMVEVVFESLARMTSHEVRFSISSYVSCSRRSLSVIRLVVDLNPAGGRSMSWCFTVDVLCLASVQRC
jgi:hypothetical protein